MYSVVVLFALVSVRVHCLLHTTGVVIVEAHPQFLGFFITDKNITGIYFQVPTFKLSNFKTHQTAKDVTSL